MAVEDWIPVPGSPGLYQRADEEKAEKTQPEEESPIVKRMRARMREILEEADKRRRG